MYNIVGLFLIGVSSILLPHLYKDQLVYLLPVRINFTTKFHLFAQCFRQSAPLRESRVTIRDGPKKNEKRANLALSFYKTAGLTQA